MGIEFEVPNIDDASVDAGDYPPLSTVFHTLGTYCSLKHTAMRFREGGEINSALRVERQMERLYASLPQWARW